MRYSFAAVADDVDHSGYGIRTVKRAFGSAYDFHGTDAVSRQRSQIERAAEIVHAEFRQPSRGCNSSFRRE